MKNLLIALSILFLVGCQAEEKSGGSSGGRTTDTTPRVISKIDLTGAKSAMISQQSTSSALSTGSGTRLLKVTDDGYVEEVSFTDASGDTVVTQSTPGYITEAWDGVTVVYFGVCPYEELGLSLSCADSVYLVNNDTGDASLISDGVPLPPPNYYVNANIFRHAAGHFYYIAEAPEDTRRQIVRINPVTMAAHVVSPADEHVVYFEVDGEGNAVYSGYASDDTQDSRLSVIHADGTIHQVPWASGFSINFWKSPNGKIYYFDPDNNGRKIMVVDVSGDVVAFNIYASVDNVFDAGMAESSYLLRSENTVLISSVLTPDIDGDYEALEVFNQDASPDSFKLKNIGIESITTAIADNTAFYFAGAAPGGGKAVVRLSDSQQIESGGMKPLGMNLGGATTLSTAYNITKMVPNGQGGIIFAGIRNADQEPVIGELDSFGNDTIFATGSQAEIDALVQLK